MVRLYGCHCKAGSLAKGAHSVNEPACHHFFPPRRYNGLVARRGRGDIMELTNSTTLGTDRLRAMFEPHLIGWKCDRLKVRLRWSRGAEFSGTCRYADRVITINLGRTNRYPYRMDTHVARPRRNRTHWWRPVCEIELRDAYQLALFVFLHELYHWFVRQSRRNTRQKEGMCDRFAARVLLDEYGCRLADSHGRVLPREEWDFRDLLGFVQGARSKRHPGPKVLPFVPRAAARQKLLVGEQRLLFPIH